VTIKGKGAVETWYLVSRKAAAAREPIGGMVAAEREEAAAG
jgi:hypothetical protein